MGRNVLTDKEIQKIITLWETLPNPSVGAISRRMGHTAPTITKYLKLTGLFQRRVSDSRPRCAICGLLKTSLYYGQTGNSFCADCLKASHSVNLKDRCVVCGEPIASSLRHYNANGNYCWQCNASASKSGLENYKKNLRLLKKVIFAEDKSEL